MTRTHDTNHDWYANYRREVEKAYAERGGQKLLTLVADPGIPDFLRFAIARSFVVQKIVRTP